MSDGKYIKQLTEKDVQDLISACIPGAEIDKVEGIGEDCITLYLTDDRGFDISDNHIQEHFISLSEELEAPFEKFMYDKFGEIYLIDHFDSLNDVKMWEKELMRAKHEASMDMKAFKEKHGL